MIEISVIIPTRNRSLYLDAALKSLLYQSFDKNRFEVIVVDNGSTDSTKSIVESYMNKIPNLVYHFCEKPGLHVGRHEGYKLSKSGILVYADDDIEAFPSWIEAIYNSFKDIDVVLVGGKDIPKYEVKPPFWILRKWYQLCSEGHCLPDLSLIDFGDQEKVISPLFVFGCNFAVRKDIVKDAGGFHPDGFPFEMIQYRGDGETHISKYIERSNMKVVYNPLASVFHIVTKERMTIDYFCQRAFRAGVERSYVSLRYGESQNVRHIRVPQIMKSLVKFFMGVSSYRLLQSIHSELHMTDMDKQFLIAEEAGFQYHQNMYYKNEYLRRWVHKESYWD